MGKLVIGVALVLAVGLVGSGLAGRALRPGEERPHLVSMAEGSAALDRGGAAVQAHGQVMLEQGRARDDADLARYGEHWLRDGRELAQRGRWLAMNPTLPTSLLASPSELSAQGSWGGLVQTSQTMLHDPSAAGTTNLEALRWNGLAMRAEGQLLAEHGRVMAEELQAMARTHELEQQTVAELQEATRAMQEVGGHLAQNGQAMLDYAERLRKSMGYR